MTIIFSDCIIMVDHGSPYDPFNRGRRGPTWSSPTPPLTPSRPPTTVWEVLGPLCVGVLGGLALGATLHSLYRWWRTRKFPVSYMYIG